MYYFTKTTKSVDLLYPDLASIGSSNATIHVTPIIVRIEDTYGRKSSMLNTLAKDETLVKYTATRRTCRGKCRKDRKDQPRKARARRGNNFKKWSDYS